MRKKDKPEKWEENITKSLLEQLPKEIEKHERAVEEAKRLSKMKYNGFAGSLPVWVPDPLNMEFLATRINLLNNDEVNYGYPQILQELQDIKENEENPGNMAYYHASFSHELNSLIYIEKIVGLGKEEGIKAYLGEGGHKIYRKIINDNLQKERAKKPRKKRNEALNKIILKALETNPNAQWKDVLRAIESLIGGGVIDNIDDKDISWTAENGTTKITKIQNLPRIITRLKKNI